MRRHLLLLALIFIAFISKAQITVTYSDMPSISDLYLEFTDSVKYSDLNKIGSSGANQTYNLTWIQNHSIDTTYYIDPAGTPYSTTFPNANLSTGNDIDGYIYLEKNPSYINIVGVVIPQDTSNLIFNLSQTILTLPNTYLTSHKDTTNIVQTMYYGQSVQGVQIDSIKFKMTMLIDCITDGWGDVQTPHYNINSLRVKTRTIQIDSTWGYAVIPFVGGSWIPYGTNVDTSYTYQWFANNYGSAIAEIEVRSDTITSSSYLINPILLNSNISKLENIITVFPNPANDLVYINGTEENCKIEIYNMLGSLCSSELIINNSINVNELNEGVYIYKLISLDNQIIKTGKLIISK